MFFDDLNVLYGVLPKFSWNFTEYSFDEMLDVLDP
jgi:hypothetical protein